MDSQALDNYINVLNEVIAELLPARVERLEWLVYDLSTYARATLKTQLYRKAWDRITYDRLEAIVVPDSIKVRIDKMKTALRSSSSGASMKIHFGQQRVAGTFQTQSINQQVIPGFPANVANNHLTVIRTDLMAGTCLPDQIPVQVFWHVQSNKWVAANNRGYTVHCMALVKPLRIIPAIFLPSDIEITRLAEVEGVGGVGPWTGTRHGDPAPRRLPSTWMFITPVGTAVTDQVEVPHQWG